MGFHPPVLTWSDTDRSLLGELDAFADQVGQDAVSAAVHRRLAMGESR